MAARTSKKSAFVEEWVQSLARQLFPPGADPINAFQPAASSSKKTVKALYEATEAAFFLGKTPKKIASGTVGDLIAHVQAKWDGEDYIEPDWVLEKLTPASERILSLPVGRLLEGEGEAGVRAEVLALYRAVFADHGESEAQILKTDPNDFDLDPAEFVELLERRYGIDLGEDYPGTISATLRRVLREWDGQTLKAVRVTRNRRVGFELPQWS